MGKRRRKGWMCTMNFCLRQLGTLEFWETLLDSFGNLGPIAPIMLAMVESFFPPLPLIAIVALNVAAHGGILGFLYSWAQINAQGSADAEHGKHSFITQAMMGCSGRYLLSRRAVLPDSDTVTMAAAFTSLAVRQAA